MTTSLSDPVAQKNIESWLQGGYDEEDKKEILRLKQENPKELVDAFYTTLSFGTGGLRGIMGVGTNRINVYTIRAATQGLANYLLKHASPKDRLSVIIGYDCRRHSRLYAEETARVLAANHIEAFIYKELRPLALVSFGVRFKGCSAGVMITASHNPPQYNGYKVYWADGGQILPPHDQGIIDEVNKIISLDQIKSLEFNHPLIHEIDEEIDEAYMKAAHALQLHPGDNYSKGYKLHAVYTSLHGAGITMIPKVLKDWGFTHLTLVSSQTAPDGNFPTIKSPNPEENTALQLGIETLTQAQGDLLMATDPDTDRIGVVVMHRGKPCRLTGNQFACIAIDHICRSLKEGLAWPPKPVFIKTIVTTEMFKVIAEHYGAQCLDVLTGFKYIGEKITQWEEEKKAHVAAHHFLFGAEESYGYLLGTHVRDKDAVICSALVCEAALQLKLKGETLVDLLFALYQRHGIYRDGLRSLTYEGKEGADHIIKIMEELRTNPPHTIAGIPVLSIEDYLKRENHFLETGKKEPLHLPKSDVLRFWLSDKTKLVIRPSGTEPKIKLYCSCEEHHHCPDRHALEKAIEACDAKVKMMLASFERHLKSQ